MAAELPPAPAALVPPPQTEPSTSASCWRSVLEKKPNNPTATDAIPSRVFGSCVSTKGVAVAVVDANAIIHLDKLASGADRFVTVREVLDEVRDPSSRRHLSFLPLPVETIEPSPDAVKKVVKFAKETGDLQTLSDVDLKLIALTYMLESQIHGTTHLRGSPPPLHVVNVKNFREPDMPGWGSNVSNLAEWEALDHLAEGAIGTESRILPLKDLDDNVVQTNTSGSRTGDQEGGSEVWEKPRRSFPPKKEIKVDENKMVAGIDASLGGDTDSTGEWQPAVGRSTHRRFLRRKERRELDKAAEEAVGSSAEVTECDDALSNGTCDGGDALASNLSHLTINEIEPLEKDEVVKYRSIVVDSAEISPGTVGLLDEREEQVLLATNLDVDHQMSEEKSSSGANIAGEGDKLDLCSKEMGTLEVSSQADGSIDVSLADDCSSEQSWMLQSLSDSSVACVTSDFAMQNVILQIGLRLLAPGGMQIRQLHRWVLKCHACNKVTQEIGRIFCPSCGNGGTLRKVSVTVGENGITLAARRQRIILRGTKFSLPLPKGGRDAIISNPILREDQLPRKLLYPKARKPNKKDDDFLSTEDIFSNTSDKRTPLKPPVKKAMAMFSGKRNPNDNHFSRRKH